MVSGLHLLHHEERLQKLGLWTLEERQNHEDLIEVFKMAHGFSTRCPLIAYVPGRSARRTHGHSWKLVKVDVIKTLDSSFSLTKWCPSEIC